MSKRGIVVGCAILGAMVASYFLFGLNNTPSIKNYPPTGTDIIALGDSLIEGVGSTNGGDFVSVLSKKIGQPIVNLGHSGDTTTDGLARLDDLQKYHPKVVLLVLGGNDALRKIPITETEKNLHTIIAGIQSQGAIVLLIGVRGGLLQDPFAAMYERLYKTEHTAFMPNILDGLFGNPQFMYDEVHPNNVGYAKIADRLYPILVPLLK